MADRDPREPAGARDRHQWDTHPTPAPDLAPFVERYWTAEWDYADPHEQKFVPCPNVQVTVRPGVAPQVHGVVSRHMVRELSGAGRIVGAQFRAGAFRAFAGGPVAELTDRDLPADRLPALSGAPAEPVEVATLEAWLRACLPGPTPDPAGQEAGEAVALVAADPGISRVDQLATASGSNVRRLQRLFSEHVGVGPKWVIRRYRLREVTERLAAGGRIDWAALAAELRYPDQAHLIHDFTDLFGESPTRYARRYPPR